ncbi:hypothetical protein [Vagococcus carniphilus]|uniref:hypothetical protein n=1 Tax=Vagococcus carniphilus TaxID=218144 RepID=UPI00288CDE95|nr:hypothetical protein [Vagococcus carniphilus]MDT2815168.1 hypothetical protein [Vagococcus carniphilus]MDT2866092.1 hypothetical protein [Vagococcus carniphilus]
MPVTSHYWTQSEKLVDSLLPCSLLLCLLLLFFLFVTLPYVKKKKYNLITMLVLTVIEGIIASSILLYATDYRYLRPYASRVNRSVESRFLNYLDISTLQEKKPHKDMVQETLRLPFYQLVDETTEPLIYLGKSPDYFYFEKNKKIYRRDTLHTKISFSKKVNAVIVDAKSAILTDNSFTSIGFYQKVGPTIFSITIPKNQESLSYFPATKPGEL